MAKIDTLFMTKTAENPYPLGPHIPIGVFSPPPEFSSLTFATFKSPKPADFTLEVIMTDDLLLNELIEDKLNY